MSVRKTISFLIICLSPLLAGQTARPGLPHSAKCSMEPLGDPVAGQTLLVEVCAEPLEECDSMTVIIRRRQNAGYVGDTAWTVPASLGETYRDTLQMLLPDTGLAGLDLGIVCGRIMNFIGVWFYASDTGVQFYHGKPYPWELGPAREPPRRRESGYDTLTEEQWSTEYDVYIQPADSIQLRRVEEILDRPLPESGRRPDGRFRVTVSLRELYELEVQLNHELRYKYVVPPPWDLPRETLDTPRQDSGSLPKNSEGESRIRNLR